MIKVFKSFEKWFNGKFGWFFTNGNKQQQRIRGEKNMRINKK